MSLVMKHHSCVVDGVMKNSLSQELDKFVKRTSCPSVARMRFSINSPCVEGVHEEVSVLRNFNIDMNEDSFKFESM